MEFAQGGEEKRKEEGVRSSRRREKTMGSGGDEIVSMCRDERGRFLDVRPLSRKGSDSAQGKRVGATEGGEDDDDGGPLGSRLWGLLGEKEMAGSVCRTVRACCGRCVACVCLSLYLCCVGNGLLVGVER